MLRYCSGIARVLLRYCEGVAPVLRGCCSLVHPLYIPCTTLVHPLYMASVSRKRGRKPEGLLNAQKLHFEYQRAVRRDLRAGAVWAVGQVGRNLELELVPRSEEHTSELQSP